MIANGLTLPQLLQAVSNSNINVGGNTVNIGTQSAVVRGVGLIRSIDSLANTMISSSGGTAVLVKDVATVSVGEQPRLGIAGENQADDIVQGIVLMRRGEQSSPTITRVEELVATINNSTILPPGVRIERIYDRKDLIETTTRTVLENMVVGILLIVVLQWIFLGDLRSAFIVGATIPFALCFAVLIMTIRGESANLLSVGALDFGLIVDATVIMVEAIFRRLAHANHLSAEEQATISANTIMDMKHHSILTAAADVSRSIFFAAAIIIAAFLPLGVHIERIYDRSDLISLTTNTVLHNLLVGVVLIFLVQWAFLGNLRSALIVSATIPFALCFAVMIMTIRGESANLLSVGALDFGLIVDATVIMMENIYRRLAEHGRRGSKPSTILGAAGEVNQAIFFAAAIIIASFIPLFTLTGVEGHIFGPMAKTYAYAIAGGLIATFTVTPALSSLMLPERVDEGETLAVRQLRRIYEPAARFALGNRTLVLGAAAATAVLALILMRTLGVEFLPHLEE
ncbi:MAG TPA: efflux RND transporter permease subunit, partial [Rhodopila sp.]